MSGRPGQAPLLPTPGLRSAAAILGSRPHLTGGNVIGGRDFTAVARLGAGASELVDGVLSRRFVIDPWRSSGPPSRCLVQMAGTSADRLHHQECRDAVLRVFWAGGRPSSMTSAGC